MMDLRVLIEKSADTDLLREMIGFAAERLIELEVGAKTGVDYGEKSAEQLAQRNGYRDRDCRLESATSSCASRACAPALSSPSSSNSGAL